jgi:hypothetical protein
MSTERQMWKGLPIVVGSILISFGTSIAQTRPDGGGAAGARRETMTSREADLENRQLRLLLLSEPEKSGTLSAEDRKVLVKQIFEDFERIQIINRDILKTSSNLDRTGYKRISSLAGDMNKRAKRLKTNLGVPDVKDEKKDTGDILVSDATQLKASVQALNVSVKSFVTSPIFKDPRATTVGQMINLRRDISSIIGLSQLVKKVAGDLD